MELNLNRGDLIRVEWTDIYEDPTGNPNEAELARRTSFGLYWDVKEDVKTGVKCLVTTTTIDEHESDEPQGGFCCYPLGAIAKIEVVKKGATRRRRVRKTKPNANPQDNAPETK